MFKEWINNKMGKISAASKRKLNLYGKYSDSQNPLFTSFKYTKLKGLSYEKGITRRDPSSILKINDLYFVWYTKRSTKKKIREGLVNLEDQNWKIPVTDWDLSDIWYATSKDGYEWMEIGCAVTRGHKGSYDDRSVFTPDVIEYKKKYYLYYQAVNFPKMRRTRNSIGMSWANSPHGPWQRSKKPIITPGKAGKWSTEEGDSEEVSSFGSWDSHKVHDPFAINRNNEIWIYYKGQPMGWHMKNSGGIAWGVAISKNPKGPFIKSSLNPITNSGHETCLFPWGKGICAIISHDGPEKDTIQYSLDGINFHVSSDVVLPPCAPGPFSVDKCLPTENGLGINWGLSHIAREETKNENSFLIRFDCNLHKKIKRKGFKETNIRYSEDVFFSKDIIAHKKDIFWHKTNNGKIADFWEGESNDCDKVNIEKFDSDIINEPDNSFFKDKTCKVSSATKRVLDIYGRFKDAKSEFFSAFKYHPIQGIGKQLGITRRDPSKIIKYDNFFYVWYTRREGPDPMGFSDSSNEIPVWDWDLSDIWFAKSKDGIIWDECGPAVIRGQKGSFDDRSVLTPDILVWKGNYYLYYQVLQGPYTPSSQYQIGMSWSKSVHGPWEKMKEPILNPSKSEEAAISISKGNRGKLFFAWDSQKLHDPFVFIRDDKIWLYYKGVPCKRNKEKDIGCAWGVAFSNKPQGPYKKCMLNPVTNSGHETFLFPYREGVVAITSLEGPEKNTVQFARDGMNFFVKGKISVPPIAAGPYIPDAFSNTKNGRGITWGLSHIENSNVKNTFLVRFECNFNRNINRDNFYRVWNYRFPKEAYLNKQFRLSKNDRIN